MRKIFSVLAIPTLVMASASAFAVNEGETSTVNFTGTIRENTCVLDNSSVGQIVDLGDVEASVLARPGDSSQPSNFTISLKDCDPSSASVTFSGETSTDEALKVFGGAEGMGIQILEDGVPLKVDGSRSSAVKEVGPESNNDFNFTARFIALDSTIKSGNATATANFTVKYE